MTPPLTVLIIGGYGRFGGRLVALLEDEKRLRLFVAGRSLEKAKAYCASRGRVNAELVAAQFNRKGDIATQLSALCPDIVVDASGPFQAYGDKPYAVVEACIARGIHYLDLADGRDFVAGIGALNSAARKAGIFALSGVSSFPVLTAAVVRKLAAGMRSVKSIRAGIAPSPYAGVGENVIRAIAGYSGQKTEIKSGNQTPTVYPLTEQMRFTIAPPAYVPLKRTLFSLVDVPDLRVLREKWPGAETVWVGAGPVPEILHRALIGFAWCVRAGLIRSLAPLSPLMHFATNRLRWGEHRGGMFVEVTGEDSSGTAVTRSWHIIAEGDDGPLIPSMAAATILQDLLDGKTPELGARASISDLELEDYDKQFAKRAIVTGFRGPPDADAPPYKRILGPAWERLPEAVRSLHAIKGEQTYEGRATVERGHGFLARLIASTIGFPKAGKDVPVKVHFTATPHSEKWTRNFAGRSFSSLQFEGTSSWEHLLCERFGAANFGIALVRKGQQLALVLRRWSLFGIPMPMMLCPRSDAYEAEENGKFHFHVEIAMPFAGLIVRYRGWLEPSA